MLVIHNDINTNASEIAKRLGLTKGAISQTLSRLEKKGMITKIKDPYNKNELNLLLTDLGKKAYQQCLEMQMSFLEAQRIFLSKLSADEKETIFKFLVNMENIVDDIE